MKGPCTDMAIPSSEFSRSRFTSRVLTQQSQSLVIAHICRLTDSLDIAFDSSWPTQAWKGIPQLRTLIKELQGQGYALPDYPENPKDDKEKDAKAITRGVSSKPLRKMVASMRVFGICVPARYG